MNIYVTKQKKFISGPIKHQCSKPYFYLKGKFETLLSQLESGEASAINKLLREKTLTKLDYKDDYIKILEFISLMQGRTFTKKKEMEKIVEDFVEKIFKPMFRADPLSKEVSDDDIKSIQIKNSITLILFENILNIIPESTRRFPDIFEFMELIVFN